MKKEILKSIEFAKYENGVKSVKNVLLVKVEDGTYETNIAYFYGGSIDETFSFSCDDYDKAVRLFKNAIADGCKFMSV